MFGRVNGIIFVFLLFISSLLGSIFILFPFVPFAFFFPRTFRFFSDRFVGYWLTFPASMISFMFGVKFRVTGDLIERNKPGLIIMNHRTRLDWLFFFNALYKMDPWLLTTEKISLKAGLKNIPGAGWAMGCGGYLFLNRNYEQDQQVIEATLKYYKESKFKYQLLLFPEGTDRGQRAIDISNAFASKHHLPRYDYVLHPRTTGFNFMLNQMRKNDYLDAIYDVTVAYPDEIISSEIELFKTGKFPKEVHFDVKRYSMEEILNEEQQNLLKMDNVDVSDWLLNLWKDKETKLKIFYEAGETGDKRQLQPSGSGFVWPLETIGIGYYLGFIFWILTSIMWIFFTFHICWIKYYILFAMIFYLAALKFKGGVEFLFLEWFNGRRMNLEKKK